MQGTGPLRKFVELYLQDLIDRVGNLLSNAMRSRLERLTQRGDEFAPQQRMPNLPPSMRTAHKSVGIIDVSDAPPESMPPDHCPG